MAAAAAGVIAFGYNGIHNGDAPQVLRTGYDYVARSMSGADPLTRCSEVITRDHGVRVVGSNLWSRSCHDWGTDQIFRGVLVDEFEGEVFLNREGSAFPVVGTATNRMAIIIDDHTVDRNMLRWGDSGTSLYALEFRGRSSRWKWPTGSMPYFSRAVVVDRVLSATTIAETPGYAEDDILVRYDPNR